MVFSQRFFFFLLSYICGTDFDRFPCFDFISKCVDRSEINLILLIYLVGQNSDWFHYLLSVHKTLPKNEINTYKNNNLWRVHTGSRKREFVVSTSDKWRHMWEKIKMYIKVKYLFWFSKKFASATLYKQRSIKLKNRWVVTQRYIYIK